MVLRFGQTFKNGYAFSRPFIRRYNFRSRSNANKNTQMTTTGTNIANAIIEINDANNFKFLRDPNLIPKHDPFNIEQYERTHPEKGVELTSESDAKNFRSQPSESADPQGMPESFLDTNEMVEELKRGGFTNAQSEIIMNVTRDALQKKMTWLHGELAPRVDMENESYLFQAAHNELLVEVTNSREISLMNLQNSSVILKRVLNNLQDETSTTIQLNDDTIRMELSQFKHENNLQQRSLEIKNTDLNNRIISELMSGLRSTIEQFRWELTRAGIFAIMLMAVSILGGWRLTSKMKAVEAEDESNIKHPELSYRHEPADEESHDYEADLDENVPVQILKSEGIGSSWIIERGFSAKPERLQARRGVANLASFKAPAYITNQTNKAFGRDDRLDWDLLKSEIFSLTDEPTEVPLVINGEEVFSGREKAPIINPGNLKQTLGQYAKATPEDVDKAIQTSLEAKKEWANTSFADRASIFLKTAELITTKYRYKMLAATMLGQGKNVFQAEIDCIGELSDFLRLNTKWAAELYASQPEKAAQGVWNRVEYRPLEGFVYAVTPFNFVAIAGNLAGTPALMGNTVVWKPSDSSILSNYLVYKIFEEAGLPKGVINFIPGDPVLISEKVFSSSAFNALHFTGSTQVFRSLWGEIAKNVSEGVYKDFPRIVGETGGKNFHLIHRSADLENAVYNTLRGAFEFQGQKCSATSRCYVAQSIWPEFKKLLVEETEKIVPANTTSSEGLHSFLGPVIHERSFDKLAKGIDSIKSDPELQLLTGGKYNKSQGYFVQPTIVQTKNPSHKFMKQEFFGPLLTCYVYPDQQYEEVLALIDSTSQYGLTGSVFATDRSAIRLAEEKLRYAAGNFYINDKCTGAVVGQQCFGGSRASGTNDKAGSSHFVSRWVTPRAIKENFQEVTGFTYPSNVLPKN
ncbi:hypothetical protein FOA43_000153 [Brettanomyces nanus]|uniref:L-glutamate gamma-semialdehyde dehydrogenase n=1 Tax=Eeniella nana TaxID=13502 RepID=A0A875RVF3_EENNA|nr:uncharacterized protein FOA43_000153 [Brettanomyces nanus]QPG72851.1 hypothetical protein FOA43_000153 [Brettanomyces nanus]